MKRFLRHDGFTLMELVVAMGVFAVGLMGLCLMSSSLMRYNQNARLYNSAVRLAQSKLESLGLAQYEGVVGSIEEALDAAGVPGMGSFVREVSVEEKNGPACKEVVVMVSWWSKGEHRVVLKTVVGP